MLKLYWTDAMPFLIKENYEKALKLADSARRAQVLSIKQEKSRALSLAAGILLVHALQECESGKEWEEREEERQPEVLHVTAEQLLTEPHSEKKQDEAFLRLDKTPAGKPYLINRPGIYFNLSHSGRYAVCALSDREVGADIQEWRDVFFKSMEKRLFDEKERQIWQKCSMEEKKACFFSVWTAKEAFVKCTGAGLTKDFRELQTDFDRGLITDTKSGETKRLYELSVLPEYSLFVCESPGKQRLR